MQEIKHLLIAGVMGSLLFLSAILHSQRQTPITGPFPPLAPTAAATTGLFGAYAMSNPNDFSGNGRTASFINTTTVQGQYGEAQAFNGNNSRVFVPNMQPTTAFTLEAWVYFNPSAAMMSQNTLRRDAVQPQNAAGGWQAIIYKGLDNFFMAEAAGFLTSGFTSGGNVKQVVAPARYTEGVLLHVATVYDGMNLIIYQNGTQIASAVASGTLAVVNSPVEFGGSAQDQGWINGRIDDVRLYTRALTLAEILSDMNTPIDTVREEVVSWTLEVWPKGVVPGQGGIAGSSSYPRANANCNLAPLTPPTTNVVNPTVARVSDPSVAGKECELLISTFINALPLGTGYTSTAMAVGATTSSQRSVLSNTFDRVAVAQPPGTPPGPVVAAPPPK